jgi:four helix bundle protein
MTDTTKLHVVPNADSFAHERLDAYRVAVEFLDIAEVLTRRLPRTKGQLGDQLARASEGVVLRIAEGAGAEYRSADQKRYFRSARGSALECAAVLDICRIKTVGTPAQITRGRALLLRIVQMLTRLSRSG